MTSPSHTLWHPHTAHDLYSPFRKVLDPEEFERFAALSDENQHAVEDIVNNPAYTLPIHFIAPSTGDVSDRYYVPESTYLVNVLGSLSAAGAGTSRIDVYRNDAAIVPAARMTFASGVHTKTVAPRQKFDADAGDFATVSCNLVDGSAAGLVVLLVFQPIA